MTEPTTRRGSHPPRIRATWLIVPVVLATLAGTALVTPGPAHAERRGGGAPSITHGHGTVLHQPTWDIWNTGHVSDGGRYMAVRRNDSVLFTRVGIGKLRRVTDRDASDDYDLSGNGRYVFFVPTKGARRFALARWDRRTARTTTVARNVGAWDIGRSGRHVALTRGEGPLTLLDLDAGTSVTVAPRSEFVDPAWEGWSVEYSAPRFVLSANGRYVAYTVEWRRDVMLFDSVTGTTVRILRTGDGYMQWVPMTVADDGRVVMRGENGGTPTGTLRTYEARTGKSARIKSSVRRAYATVASGDGRRVVLRRESTRAGRMHIEEWLWNLGKNKARLVNRSTRSGGWSIDGYLWDLDYSGRNGAYIEGGWQRTSGGEKLRPVRWRG